MSRAMKAHDIIRPDFFIAGFHKCATFSMYHNLNKHPQIDMGQFKEPLTFARDYHWSDIDRVYRKHYAPGRGKMLGDSNVYNSVVKYVPERIRMCNPRAKIIFMVRNPVDRIYTQWRHLCRLRPGTEVNNFPAVIERAKEDFDLNRFELERDYVPTMCRRWNNYHRMYLEIGCYDYYISHWERYFEDILVINFDDYVKDPDMTYAVVQGFLGVPYVELKREDRNMDDWHGEVYSKHPEIAGELEYFYESWNKKMEARGISWETK